MSCDPIVFVDATLEAAVRHAVGKTEGALGLADVATLSNLSVPALASLAGIECLTGLTSLAVNNGQISDLTPLAPLSQLSQLDLASNPIAALDVLATLPKLTGLDLAAIPGQLDLTPLARSRSLVDLSLNENEQLGDLTALGAIPTLRRLSLRSTTLLEPASLSALRNVSELYASNALADASPLAPLTQLTVLDITSNQLTDISALGALTHLTKLDVSSNQIANISALSGMRELDYLDISNNQIADLSALTQLAALYLLYAQQNQIADLTPLVQNAGIASQDLMFLKMNPLDCNGQAPNIATLRARGVNLLTDCE